MSDKTKLSYDIPYSDKKGVEGNEVTEAGAYNRVLNSCKPVFQKLIVLNEGEILDGDVQEMINEISLQIKEVVKENYNNGKQ